MATQTRAHGRRGNYSMLFGLSMTLVIGFGALSLDVGLMTMSRLQAQASADAASHAALVTYHQNMNQSEGVNAAGWVVDHSTVGMGTPLMVGTPEFGIWHFTGVPSFDNLQAGETPNAVRVTVSRSGSNAVKTMLGGFLGVPTFDVQATSIAAQEMRSLMLVQDMSCSMMYSPGQAIIDSHEATLHFYEYLRDHPQPMDKLGIAMFASSGTLPYDSPTVFNMDPTAPPWLPLSFIEDNDTLYNTAINGICNTLSSSACGTASGADDPHPLATEIGECTNPAIGIQQATDELSDPSNNEHFKGILFFSDGVPTSTGSFWCDDPGGAAANADAAATTAWNMDINIWALLLHGSSFDTSFMQAMPRGVGFYQESSQSSDLDAMYQQVARSLPTTFVD